jgi:hypothetical protein
MARNHLICGVARKSFYQAKFKQASLSFWKVWYIRIIARKDQSEEAVPEFGND